MDVVDHNWLDKEVSLRLLGDKVIFLYYLSRQHCLWKEHLDPWSTFMEWILKFPFLNVLIAIYIFLSSCHLRFVAFYLFNYVYLYQYQYQSMDMCLFFQLEFNATLLLGCLTCSMCGHWTLSSWYPCVTHAPWGVWDIPSFFFLTSLLYGTVRCSKFWKWRNMNNSYWNSLYIRQVLKCILSNCIYCIWE